MDDLLGEDWQAPSKPAYKPAPTSSLQPSLSPSPYASNFGSALRASPTPPPSGLASPYNISRPSSTLNSNGTGSSAAAIKSKSQNDSFGNLVSLKGQKSATATSNLSLLEQQQRALAEKKRQQEDQAKLWNTLGSGGAASNGGLRGTLSNGKEEAEEDILAAFSKDVPVDRASHFPPPSLSAANSGRSTPAASAPPVLREIPSEPIHEDEDDDPFGLGSIPQRTNGHTVSNQTQPTVNDEDDILGDLGRPVEAVRVQKSSTPARTANVERTVPVLSSNDDPQHDGPVAELVEMGFPVDNAQLALAENGGDVQRAVGWLLQQAHEQSRQKTQSERPQRRPSPTRGGQSPPRVTRDSHSPQPSWMQESSRSSSAPRRDQARSPASGERDAAQVAQDLGSKLFKSANSLWKASQKQMTKTIAEFQQERETSQPKWMQETQADTGRSSSQARQPARAAPSRHVDLTDEAAMLDAPRDRPQKPSSSALRDRPQEHPRVDQRQAEPSMQRAPAPARPVPQAGPLQDKRPATKLSRQEVEDASAQAYISPARRKKTTPKPEPTPEPEVDLFSPAPSAPAVAPRANHVPAKTTPAASAQRPSQTPAVPKAPPRTIPNVSSFALSASASHRKAGGEAFKRGDYDSAHNSYTAALQGLPPTHPIIIVVLTNRCLTGLKTGDAKAAVSDADRALNLIGASQGIGESIDLGSDGSKEMRDFYAKALTRKAEALEHLEKWADAAAVWRTAIGAGVGGAISLRGRDRCEKAATPQRAAAPSAKAAAPRPTARAAPPAKGLGNSLNRPALSNIASDKAVERLRAANAAAEKADDEKFALNDQVEARLTAWKGGKADNLRALLQSLDGVLWAEAGWKKVGMADLVLPNKVKIIYMKAIAKVHPDKIPQNATTEQRMISGAVFSTLNEAWDKFKKDNNL